jgi:hypothetical protein
VTDELTMTLTNDENNFSYTTNFFFSTLLQNNNWQGYNPKVLSFPRKGGQGAENLRKKNRHVHEYKEDL